MPKYGWIVNVDRCSYLDSEADTAGALVFNINLVRPWAEAQAGDRGRIREDQLGQRGVEHVDGTGGRGAGGRGAGGRGHGVGSSVRAAGLTRPAGAAMPAGKGLVQSMLVVSISNPRSR